MPMSQLDVETLRAGSCPKAFRIMMWALVFFVPIPILNTFPDVVGWILFLIAIQMVPRLHRALGPMRLLAGFGLALWIGRTAAPTQELYLILYLTTWAILMLFMWKTCGMIMEIAEAAKAASLAWSARWRRWLCLLPFFLFAVAANSGSHWPFMVTFLFMLAIACVLCLLMGLMADTSRMCALMGQTQPAGTDPAKTAS